MTDNRPAWARRLISEREGRDWTQADAVRAVRVHAQRDGKELPSDASLLRQWKRWESGEVQPAKFYQPLIAAVFGTVTRALFPEAPRSDLTAGMDTLELVNRFRRSDMDQASLDSLEIITDRLCSRYAFVPAGQLLDESRAWLRRIMSWRDQRVTLTQHRDLLVLAGWTTLLISCTEYDTGNRQDAETARRAALSLAGEAGHADIGAWAHEIRAWIALTSGKYQGVISAAREGADTAPRSGVAAQLAAQEAKAWARIGDRRQTEVALDRGRRLLDTLPCPDNLANHFAIDPGKFDFYAMDCYRYLAEDRLAVTLAGEVIRAGTGFDGTDRAPMRMSEARITLGVTAARSGDLEAAVHYGREALNRPRKSVPHLLMLGQELTTALTRRYPDEDTTAAWLDQLHALTQTRPESTT